MLTLGIRPKKPSVARPERVIGYQEGKQVSVASKTCFNSVATEPARSPVRLRVVAVCGLSVVMLATLGACGREVASAPTPRTLEQAFGLPESGDVGLGSQAEIEHDLVQRSIVECMMERGFEYTPEPFDSGELPTISDEQPEALLESNGFGLSLAWGNPDFEPAVGGTAGDLEHDVNYEYRESLTESELSEYEIALEGGPGGAGDSCYARARGDVVGGRDARAAAAAPFRAELSDRISNDSRILGMDDQWSDCMTTQGYDFGAVDDMYEYLEGGFTKRLARVLGLRSLDEASPAVALPVGANLDQLLELHDEERTLAVSHDRCSGEAYSKIGELTQEIEAEYVVENAERIESTIMSLETDSS
jgi:hypothetical protein